MQSEAMKPGLAAEVLYALLVCGWQIVGLANRAIGNAPLAPTASTTIAIASLLIAALCVF